MVWLSQISVLHMKFYWENCYCKDLYETVWTKTTAPLHLLSVRIIQKLVLISKPQLLHCAHQVNCNYLKTLCHQMIIWWSYCWLWLFCGYKNGFLFFEPWKWIIHHQQWNITFIHIFATDTYPLSNLLFRPRTTRQNHVNKLLKHSLINKHTKSC